MGAVFVGDYVSDQTQLEKTTHAFENSVITSAEAYSQLFNDFKNKTLSEKLYLKPQKMKNLLASIHALRNYATESPLQKMVGLRWVSPQLKVMGPYGAVANFDPKQFLTFFRSLDQMPNKILISKINDDTYLGLGIAEEGNTLGYLLVPFPLETIVLDPDSVHLRMFSLSLDLDLPLLGILLDSLKRKPFSVIQISKSFSWGVYFLENAVSYGFFILFAIIVLLFKRRYDTEQLVELSRSNKTTQCLKNNLQAQQKGANLIIDRLHEVQGSISELSTLLLDIRSSKEVLNEKEITKLMRKIYTVSTSVEKKIIRKANTDPVNIIEVIELCMNFYAYKIENSQIEIKTDFGTFLPPFISEKDAFIQLVLNIFNKAVEGTPEQGTLWMKVIVPEKKSEGILILAIESNGYAFSPETLRTFMRPNQTLFEDYFNLEWEEMVVFAKSIGCSISHQSLGSQGNRMTLEVYDIKKPPPKKEMSFNKFTSANNIINLFSKNENI
jgi:signal transduction histidine kinase